MKKIKVLIITGTMNLGGIENQMMHLLRNADPNLFQIDFTTTISDPYYRNEIESLGGKCITIPEMNILNPFPYCYHLYRLMKEEAYDIVHSHELFHSGIVLLTAYLAGVNGRFCHAHNWKDSSGDGKKRSFIRSVYNYVMQAFIRKFSTHMLACSTYAGQFLYGEKVAQDKRFHLLFNSVDTHKFLDRQSESITDEFCDNWTNVLNVGRVTTVKNQIFLTKIAAVLKARSKKIRILCAGSGDDDYMNALNTIISEASLESHIKLLGPRDDVSELMKKSSAFVLPSHYEGMPLVIIEAQSAGLPCVCADTFSHEVDFGLNQIQWLPLECTPETWADAIENACSCSKANVQDIQHVIEEKGFDSNTFAQMLCSLYKSSLEGMNT